MSGPTVSADGKDSAGTGIARQSHRHRRHDHQGRPLPKQRRRRGTERRRGRLRKVPPLLLPDDLQSPFDERKPGIQRTRDVFEEKLKD